MTLSPPRRLTAVAWVLGAVFAVGAGLVLWRFAGTKPAMPEPVLADDVARQFMPGELGHEPGWADDRGAAVSRTRNAQRATPNAEVLNPSRERGFFTRALGGVDRANEGAWSRFNLLTPRLGFSHNLGRVFPSELAATHPEFFPEEAGRRIQPPVGAGWWNPDLGREDVAVFAAGKAREFFGADTGTVSFALGVNDGLIFGESPETLALTTPLHWFRERPDYSNLVFTFMNRAAADLAQTHPDKYLGALAYYWAENAPDSPVQPQVIPFLTADRSQGYDPAFRTEERALQARWAARMRSEHPTSNAQHPTSNDGMTDSKTERSANSDLRSSRRYPPVRIGLYDYLYGHGFLIPRIHSELIAENLREARRLGFTDYFAEMTPNWGLDGPQPWLVAQLLQDPEQNELQLLAEYYRRYFKESAFLMQRFFVRCEEQWMNQAGRSYWLKHYRNESQAGVFPMAVCRELRGLLDEAASRARTDLVRRRVQQVRDAFGVTERFVAMQEARDRVDRLALSSDGKVREIMLALARFQAMRQSLVDYTRQLQVEQPLLIAPFVMDDYLRHDPTAMALAQLLGNRQGRGLAEAGNHAAVEPAQWAELGLSGTDSPTLWLGLREVRNGGETLSINGDFSGEAKPARMIAGLTYGVSLPDPWQSRVEPAQFHEAKLAVTDGRLRIAGSKDTQVFQWIELGNRTFAEAQVQVRGRVPVSGVAMLTLGWLDSDHRNLGTTVIRLPEGEWPEWVWLLQAGEAPAGAAWVGIGMRVQHQSKDDWIEVKGFALRAR